MPNQLVTISPYSMHKYNQLLKKFFRVTALDSRFHNRLSAAAKLFLDCPYLWEALGEGVEGKYDQYPLYRTDQFDCVTYLNTVLALSKSQTLASFQHNILKIRYNNGIADYTQRTDWFTDLEWLPNTRQLGWIEDMTTQIYCHTNSCLTVTAKTIIDKPNWYRVKTLRSIRRLAPFTNSQAANLLMQLQKEGNAFQPTLSSITYIPTAKLIDANGDTNLSLFKQIPSAAVVIFVRPNWDIRDNFKDYPQGYGSNLNVCHVGLVIEEDNTIMLYNASMRDQKVFAIPLADYLKRNIGIIEGIHLEKIIA